MRGIEAITREAFFVEIFENVDQSTNNKTVFKYKSLCVVLTERSNRESLPDVRGVSVITLGYCIACQL